MAEPREDPFAGGQLPSAFPEVALRTLADGMRAVGARQVVRRGRQDARGRLKAAPRSSSCSACAHTADRPFHSLALGVWHDIALDAGDQVRAWREDYADHGPTPFTEILRAGR
jgi:hypothetical protein